MARSGRLVTNGQLRWWYRRLNAAYFGGRLPMPGQLIFRRRMDDLGHTLFFKVSRQPVVMEIALSGTLRSSLDLCLIVLLHEMAHVARPRAGHGPAHKAEIRRLFRAGAYKNLL